MMKSYASKNELITFAKWVLKNYSNQIGDNEPILTKSAK